jgi:hypothetical protein
VGRSRCATGYPPGIPVMVTLLLVGGGALGCSSSTGDPGGSGTGGSATGGRSGGGGTGGRGAGGAGSGSGGAPALGTSVTVRLVPRAGVSGTTRVSFAVPLGPGQLTDAANTRVLAGSAEQPAARRVLARYRDGSARSVQFQVDADIAGESTLTVELGRAATAGDLPIVPVASTLDPEDGTAGPRVWALLPAAWLSASGVAGLQIPEADSGGPPLDAWGDVCDYERYDVENFLGQQTEVAVWLFDRGTTAYRGYVRRGDLLTLETAYRETAIYRARITGTGAATRIAVAQDDVKYHYTQNMALHYLLTGDDRFREAAEAVARRVAALWTSPGYAGGEDFWTERSAGFALLAYVWAMIVSDDAAAELQALADAAVSAYLSVQETYPAGYTDRDARCFAHSAEAHGEGFGYWGCSPWMSGVLADALDGYVTERAGSAQGEAARTALVKLGRIVARDGRDEDGKPFYWMGVGTDADEVDPNDEHWGESAYLVALGWHHGGRSDPALETAARALATGFAENASVPHMRSFNWQCRSSVATPYYLR